MAELIHTIEMVMAGMLKELGHCGERSGYSSDGCGIENFCSWQNNINSIVTTECQATKLTNKLIKNKYIHINISFLGPTDPHAT